MREIHQTGPKTEAGKAVSSLNGVTHACSGYVFRIAKNEREEDWAAFRQTWFDDYDPREATFRRLVEQAAEAEWLLRRTCRFYDQAEGKLPLEFEEWSEGDHQRLQLAMRYRTTAERRFHRARANVEQVRRSRQIEECRAEGLAVRLKHELEKDEEREAKRESGQKKAKEKGPTREEKRREVDETKARLAEIERNRQPQLHQYVELAEGAEGALVTKKRPTNEELLKQAMEKEPPATQVWRHMWFPRELPAEYAWVETADSGTINPRLQIMPFEQWKELIEWEEKELGTHIGPLKREEFWRGEKK